MLKDFREFINRGNVLDLAVGVIIGGAFGKIVASLVNDVIMPFISLALAGVNTQDLAIVLKTNADPAKNVVLKYGNFLQATIDFLIIAFVIFIFVRTISKLQRKKEEVVAEPVTPEEILLLREIRDQLKQK